MPRSEQSIVSAESHRVKLREVLDQDLSEDQVLRIVGNTRAVLPFPKVDADVVFMPCVWLGSDGSDDSVFPETRAQQAQARLGWREAKYLLILPFPSQSDVVHGVGLSPNVPISRFLREQLAAAGIDLRETVATYATRVPFSSTLKSYTQAHKNMCGHYARSDIKHIQPKVIITFGAEALKVLFGRTAPLDTYRGSVWQYELDGVVYPVVPTASHFQFISTLANLEVFSDELKRAASIVDGSFVPKSVRSAGYRVCQTLAEVRELCDIIRVERPPFITFDTETGNDLARDEFKYTLSIQLAWAPGRAAFIRLRGQRMEPAYTHLVNVGKARKDGTFRQKEVSVPERRVVGQRTMSEADEKAVWELIQQLFLDRSWKLAAHHLRVDVEPFARAGYPIDERVDDGIDTMLIHHLLYGDSRQGLDHLIRKYVPEFGAYWADLEEWLTDNGRPSNLQFGYRNIPEEILIPYGLIDADGTHQIVPFLLDELHANPALWKLYWTHVSRTSRHLMLVERRGILIDEAKRTELREMYEPIYVELLQRLRDKIAWPDFNPASNDQKAALLYSKRVYRNKKPAPEGAIVLDLQPKYNTDKYPRAWSDIEAKGEAASHTPSTKAKSVELLTIDYPDVPELRMLCSLSVLGKFLNTYLTAVQLNEFGVPEDGKSIANNIGADGRVRTHLSQLTETGRYSSHAANLQTKPKKQEAAVHEALCFYYFGCSAAAYAKRTFDGKKAEDGTWERQPYTGADRIEMKDRLNRVKFAECFIPRPGCVFIEADFKTAELFVWAYSSGDPRLVEICDSGRDLHSEVAAAAFNLPPVAHLAEVIAALVAGNPAPYAAWNKAFKAEYESQRIGAKTVNFGIMYGRQAPALAREVQAQGVDLDTEGAQRIIDKVASDFPVAWAWLEEGANAAVKQEWTAQAFGRRRYFTGASQMSRQDQAAVKREAKNSRIQGMVADLLAQAGFRLEKAFADKGMESCILLPIHDAFLFEVPYTEVIECAALAQQHMSTENFIPGTNYKLGLDVEIFPTSWGDKGVSVSKFPDVLRKLGVTV